MDGNDLQSSTVLAGVADAAVARFDALHPQQPQPAWQKWVSGIAAALMTLFLAWLVWTVNDMQVTLARMDERLSAQDVSKGARDDEQDRRIERLEGYHTGGGQ